MDSGTSDAYVANETPQSQPAPFLTRTGVPVPTCLWSEWLACTQRNLNEDQISTLQMVECSGFSLAMVVRFALGHTAHGGTVTAFVTDSLYGYVVASAARHLLNSGSTLRVVLPPHEGELSKTLTDLLIPLQNRGGAIFGWDTPEWGELAAVVESSHNVLCGITDAVRTPKSFLDTFAEQMNESRVPVHCVGAPLGASWDDSHSTQTGEQLYASSTLSLGLPLSGLAHTPDLVGRHYLCDVGWAPSDYLRLGYTGAPLFCEQPVIQLLSNLGE